MPQDGEGAAGARRPEGLRDPDQLVGRTVGGKYRVIEVLARGGMGRIYRAEQVPLGRPVALKILHSELSEAGGDPGFQRRFLLEAASCARLRHPNIVVVYDYGRVEEIAREAYFMAMELVEGQTLGQVLKSEGPFEIPRALRIAREVARALREAHRQGMVHRDLKPSNVMLVPSAEGEQVKVLDFGLVKVLRDVSEELTQEGHFLGSPKYMAPEQIKRTAIDGRTDLYALGVLLYQMLTGRVPFEGEQPVQTLMAHLTEPVPPIPADLGVPPEVEAIVRRCLEKDPGARFPSADAFIRAVDEATAVLGWASARQSMLVSSETPTTLSGSLALPRALAEAGVTDSAQAKAPAEASAVTAPPSRRGRTLAMIGLAATAALGGGWLAVVLSGSGGSSATTQRAPFSSPTPAPPASASTAVSTNPAAPAPRETTSPTPAAGTGSAPSDTTFTLFVASDPPGATLKRGERALGTTPTFVVLQSAELASSPATFRLELEGYAPYVWTQAPSDHDVRIAARLEPLSDARGGTQPRPRPPRPRTSDAPAPPPESSPRPSGEDLMIKTSR